MSAPEDGGSRRRSGPTQVEGERKRQQVLLRLTAEELRLLDDQAREWGLSRSDAVARLAADAVRVRRG